MTLIEPGGPPHLLSKQIDTGPIHLRPLFRAVRDRECALSVIYQGRRKFSVPSNFPTICIIGDDAEVSCGPWAFDITHDQRFS